jgi:hypothetical protein
MLGKYMSSVNDSPNHFVLDAVSRGMNSIGMIAKVMRVEGIGEGGKHACLAALRSDCRGLQEGEKQ